MALTIDWGTLVVSIPVVITTALAATKYLVKAYSNEHFEKRMESFKAELQQEAEKRKLEMEKEHTEYLKKLDSKMIVSADYIQERYVKIKEIRALMQDKFLTVKNASPSDSVLSSYIETEIRKYLDNNRMYFTDEYIDFIDSFILHINEARMKMYEAYVIRDSTKFTNAQKYERHEQASESFEKLEALYHQIEKHLRNDYLGAL
ncbi:hypothetical protein [Paenibacillus xylanexedens]|uniref:hypothetical protein n=1 Tax=Paenibacillus xylanexedens TaxID=528191 RepID=UPI000F533675|nr:hypothetical protein [Paenibacillus xylanexedens]